MSSMPQDALNTSASKPGVMDVASSTLRALARLISSCGSEMSAGVILFMTFGGGVPQHPLGADVENLDDAPGVGGDAGEIGTVEDRALQRASFQQRFCVAHLAADIVRFREVSRKIVHGFAVVSLSAARLPPLGTAFNEPAGVGPNVTGGLPREGS